jgi:predicted nucleotidyltransferase component of viral defense system
MNTSRQLTDLIKNKACNLELDAQLLLKRYFMEQMLARIAQSEYRTNFILKGGLLISSLIGLSSRTTQDIDVSIINKPLSIEEIKQVMTNVCKIDLNDNIKYELTNVQEIREEFEYPGIRLTFKVYMDNIVDSLKMDITTGDTITPKEITYGYKLLLEDKIINLCSYPIETIIAEKIESILSKSILGTRMRDYYDIYMLEKLFKDRINKENQKQALLNTCAKRNTSNVLTNPNDIIADIQNDWGQQNLWKNYANKNTYVGEVSFGDTIKSINSILKMIEII